MFDELLICHEMREQKFVDKLAEEAVVLESWRIDVWRPRGPLPRQDPPYFTICEILVQCPGCSDPLLVVDIPVWV